METRSSSLLLIGLFATAIYLILLAGYAYHEWAAIRAMSPNEAGDMVAGSLTPLGMLWLVLGFKLQSDELQNSIRELESQSTELKNSVEQQRMLVDVAREQLSQELAERRRQEEETDRNCQPVFILSLNHQIDARILYQLFFESAGPPCSSLSVEIKGKIGFEKPVFNPGDRVPVSFSEERGINTNGCEIRIEYRDLRGRMRAQSFKMPVSGIKIDGGSILNRIEKVPGYEKLD